MFIRKDKDGNIVESRMFISDDEKSQFEKVDSNDKMFKEYITNLKKPKKTEQEKTLEVYYKSMDLGKEIIAKVSHYNMTQRKHKFTVQQMKDFVETFASIKGLLEVGALETALIVVTGTPQDGTFVTKELWDMMRQELSNALKQLEELSK